MKPKCKTSNYLNGIQLYIILFILFIFIISCQLLDKIEDQKADVTITLDYSQLNKIAKMVNGESDALNIASIDKAKLVIYDIDQSYTTVNNNYTEMVLPSTGSKYNFEEYWMNGVEEVLDDISNDKCTIESENDLNIEGTYANGEFEIDPGVKYFLVGLYENGNLKYGGYSGIENFKIGESKTVSISLQDSLFEAKANTGPTASFTSNPPTGDTTTVFIFDANASSDIEDTISVLQVRWDWENDGSYDTNYNTVKTETHQYSTHGTYTIKMEVKDSEGLTDTIAKTMSVTNVNTAPTSSFTINPTSGTTTTIFTFDASSCSDTEDTTLDLQVRWDWENDGIWDTEYSTNKTSTFQYIVFGNYTVKLEVMDSGGLNTNTTKEVLVNAGTVTDIDGNVYNTVQIGDQLWMAENLKVTRYRNGDTIPNVTDDTEWESLSNGAYCSYDNEDSNIETYGLLYNWYTIDDSRGLAPTGWHVPTDEEWKQLELYLGMSRSEADDAGYRGTDEGSKLKSTSGWYNNGNGTNESGFSAVPGGYRRRAFNGLVNFAFFWSATKYISSEIWVRLLASGTSSMNRDHYYAGRGFNVRCIYGQVYQNTAPFASFAIDLTTGTTNTTFTFDASGSTDNEDATSELEVRWDWENDGTYDTNYNTVKTETHQYSTQGTYTIKMEVKDSGGLTNTTTEKVTVSIEFAGTVTDIDGNVYNTVQIGDQLWMAENLKVTRYRNGDAIPNVTDDTEWGSLTNGAYCSYDNDDSNITTYGLLYNWHAVDDARGLAPTGWHVPTDEEWKELEIYLGMSQTVVDDTGWRGTDEGGKLKEVGTSYWDSLCTEATNESGFSARPGGYRSNDNGLFINLIWSGNFWVAAEYNSSYAWYRSVFCYHSDMLRDEFGKLNGISVRCIGD